MNGTIALQPPVGTIALQESRQTVTNMAAYYQGKYKELLERKGQIEKANKDGEVQRAISGTAAKFALTFTPTIIRGLGRLAINIGTPIVNWINKIKDNQSIKEVNREITELKQAYARETGQEIDIEAPQEEQGGKTL